MPVRPSWMANAPALPVASSQRPPGQPHTTSASLHESQILRDPVDNSVSIRFMMGPMSTSIEFSSEEQFGRHGLQILQQAHSASLQLAMMSTQMSMNPTSHSMGLQMMPGAQNMMPSIMSATSQGATNMPAISAGATPGIRNQPALTTGDTAGDPQPDGSCRCNSARDHKSICRCLRPIIQCSADKTGSGCSSLNLYPTLAGTLRYPLAISQGLYTAQNRMAS